MWTLILIRFAPYGLTASTIYCISQYPAKTEAEIVNMFLVGVVLTVGYFVAFWRIGRILKTRIDLIERELKKNARINSDIFSAIDKVF